MLWGAIRIECRKFRVNWVEREHATIGIIALQNAHFTKFQKYLFCVALRKRLRHKVRQPLCNQCRGKLETVICFYFSSQRFFGIFIFSFIQIQCLWCYCAKNGPVKKFHKLNFQKFSPFFFYFSHMEHIRPPKKTIPSYHGQHSPIIY